MSAPKNRCTHSHDRGPFLDGHLEVPAHSHRQLVEHRRGNTRCLPLVAQLSELPEPRARIFRRFRIRGQRHEPNDFGGAACGCGFEEPRHLAWRYAELRGFPGEIHLNQQFRRVLRVRGCLVKLVEELDAVNRLNHRERRRRLSGLVRLQVTKQMPPD
jgi:hypothetical protein